MEKNQTFMNDGTCNSPNRNTSGGKERDNTANLFLECLKMDEELMIIEQSPKKHYRQDATNDKESFSDSTHKKKAAPFEEAKNPFSMFYEDIQQKNFFKQCQKAQIIELSFIQQQKQIQIVEQVSSLLQPQILQQYPYTQQYNEILRQIDHNQEPVFTNPIFFQDSHEESELTKLILFRLNKKNGRNLRYDENAKTIRPFFKCEGCKKQFKVSSALGGHLSKCDKKQKHFRLVAEKQWIMEKMLKAGENEDAAQEKKEVQYEQDNSWLNPMVAQIKESGSEDLLMNILKEKIQDIVPLKERKRENIFKRAKKMRGRAKKSVQKKLKQKKTLRKKGKSILKRGVKKSPKSVPLKSLKMDAYWRK